MRMLFNRIVVGLGGFDLLVNGTWYGIHCFWQSIPMFGTIVSHRKCDSVHEYGLIAFGLQVYFKIDE